MRETLELAREAAGERTNAVASCVNNLAEVLRYQVRTHRQGKYPVKRCRCAMTVIKRLPCAVAHSHSY
jgi:hypothetical protein